MTYSFATVVPTIQAQVSTGHGGKSINFLVDTGASRTLLPLRDALTWLPSMPASLQPSGLKDAQGKPLIGCPLPVTISIPNLWDFQENDSWLVKDLAWPLLGSSSFFHRHGFVSLNWPGHRNGRRFALFIRRT
jgi:hypothetical protein